MEDLALIEAIANDDRHAFNSLFSKYYHPLVVYITTFTRDVPSSEDIVQQVFISLWEKRHKLEGLKSVKPYLYKIAYNTFIDQYRKTKNQDLFLEELRQDILRAAITENKDQQERRILKLKKLINTLPPKCKEILELNKLRGLNYKEIAKKLNVSEKTIEAQMRIAFKKIRLGFEDDKLLLPIIFRKFSKKIKLQLVYKFNK
ncbi:RNA polymerase sigma factor [Aestuariibaculum suncheonense]|uniref:RNA polymerase sigma-70 factor n=1 Tax=Aestuariibaculum suncheonense TaxID=1028745 RepID=A0A8J6QYV2_9FLAO|nr:RNA polymerase sigma-70 factor [Aestuariibaculum suncheonense]MBD0837009.1 RNA polymerase sigma-70 factor [Aestuariibaculum suncheonense]